MSLSKDSIFLKPGMYLNATFWAISIVSMTFLQNEDHAYSWDGRVKKL